MFDYPALYMAAGALSQSSQNMYFRIILLEYALLFVAAALSLEFSQHAGYYVIFASIFLLSIAAMVARYWLKPEQDWYKGRALAESIKTSCWRYCMRAEPFGDADDVAVRRSEFRNHLRAILEANRHIGRNIPPDSAANDQITETMEKTRALPLEERKSLYETHRIREQRTWYAKKASANRSASKRWLRLGLLAYSSAIMMVLVRIGYPRWEIWPVEPLIVLASSLIGWTQIKKFNELASSYTLTAHEIGIIQGRIKEVDREEDFSDFVNEAEQAFSREHTQWVARQQVA